MIDDVLVFHPPLDFRYEGFVDAYRSSLLSLAEEMDVPKVEPDIFGLEVVELGAPEPRVD